MNSDIEVIGNIIEELNELIAYYSRTYEQTNANVISNYLASICKEVKIKMYEADDLAYDLHKIEHRLDENKVAINPIFKEIIEKFKEVS